MARAKRNRSQRQADLERMLTWRSQGWSERRIAAALGLSPSTVHRDLEELDQRWVEAIPDKVTILKRGQLAAVNHLIAEAWDSFQESRKTAMRVVEVQKRVPVPEQAAEALEDGVTSVLTDEFMTVERRIETTTGPGDPRFLKVIAEGLQDRAKLLGLYDGSQGGMPDVELRHIIEVQSRKLGMSPDQLYARMRDTFDEAQRLAWDEYYGVKE